MSTDSPRHLKSNTPNHLVESHVGTSRDTIKVDLVGKIVYNDLAVFRRLRVERVSTDLVMACAASFNAENKEEIKLLKELVERASMKTPEALELEEINDMANDLSKEEKSGNHGSAEEKKMYDPLVHLFNFIAVFDRFGAGKFQRTNGMLQGRVDQSSSITLKNPKKKPVTQK